LKKNILKFYEVNKNTSNKIILEILENHEIKDYDAFNKQLLELKEIGALLAIDDFGSGYSNLSHIIGISPHYLKIDGSLIKDIVTNQKSKKIVRGLVQLAKELGIKTVAEFVANKDIFDVVYELGIDEFQGYYFAEPMSLK
jgi:EAL domain-containing protein (putative c-di-GMP-specific phosphodiesterase class I)